MKTLYTNIEDINYQCKGYILGIRISTLTGSLSTQTHNQEKLLSPNSIK